MFIIIREEPSQLNALPTKKMANTNRKLASWNGNLKLCDQSLLYLPLNTHFLEYLLRNNTVEPLMKDVTPKEDNLLSSLQRTIGWVSSVSIIHCIHSLKWNPMDADTHSEKKILSNQDTSFLFQSASMRITVASMRGYSCLYERLQWK